MVATIDLFVEDIRHKVRSLGFKELRTPEDVDEAIKNNKRTLLIFVNSTCGCAGGIARPAVEMALNGKIIPDDLATVFAGQDSLATERARNYFIGQPPSSPSFAIMKDGKFAGMIHRSDIEGRNPHTVAEMLKALFRSTQ
ncbi:MAG TPA: BrxA/BrxB family bacilliredoxin [Candidatus Acidoferrales bacterium]|nr:BrxA/BrxB family bacilliredoxin [Candidatus Acidoferrales bacterium]